MQYSNFLFSISTKQINKKLQIISPILFKKIYFLNIKSTLNNFYVLITNISGKLVLLQSGGMLGLPMCKRNSNYSLELALLNLLKSALKLNIFNFILKLDFNLLNKKQLIIKILQKFRVKIIGIQLTFMKVFNGVRLKKKRRI